VAASLIGIATQLKREMSLFSAIVFGYESLAPLDVVVTLKLDCDRVVVVRLDHNQTSILNGRLAFESTILAHYAAVRNDDIGHIQVLIQSNASSIDARRMARLLQMSHLHNYTVVEDKPQQFGVVTTYKDQQEYEIEIEQSTIVASSDKVNDTMLSLARKSQYRTALGMAIVHARKQSIV
jgi:hypothetical protein